jgi:hypothetical protein
MDENWYDNSNHDFSHHHPLGIFQTLVPNSGPKETSQSYP